MIVFKDNSWQIDGSYPDFDYTRYTKVYDNESSSFVLKEKEDYFETDNPVVYVISDDSPLTSKVMQYAPYMKILTDEEGNVIDVIEEYPIDVLIDIKCSEINVMCENTIKSGIDYNGEHYDLTNEDQINISDYEKEAKLGSSVAYHSSDNPWRLYTSEEFLDFVDAVNKFKKSNLIYCNLLKAQVKKMTDSSAIKAIEYGKAPLNDEYKTLMNNLLKETN